MQETELKWRPGRKKITCLYTWGPPVRAATSVQSSKNKWIELNGYPENGTSRIQSAVTHIFSVYVMELTNLQTLNNQVEIERHRLNSWSSIFRAGNLFQITSFGENSKIHDTIAWKQSILRNFLIKEELNFLVNQYIV
jgi:hypothetical protein